MAAQYEKRVLTMDAWGQKQGYPPFCEVVTQEDGLANLQLIVDKVRGKEVPRVPAVSAFIEFCVGMMTGEVEKGGCRELRADPINKYNGHPVFSVVGWDGERFVFVVGDQR